MGATSVPTSGHPSGVAPPPPNRQGVVESFVRQKSTALAVPVSLVRKALTVDRQWTADGFGPPAGCIAK